MIINNNVILHATDKNNFYFSVPLRRRSAHVEDAIDGWLAGGCRITTETFLIYGGGGGGGRHLELNARTDRTTEKRRRRHDRTLQNDLRHARQSRPDGIQRRGVS